MKQMMFNKYMSPLLHYNIMNIMSILIMIIFIMIGMSFLTLMERKILGYIQIRKGPNKSMIKGLTQPFNDAIKLFSKEVFIIHKSNTIMFFMSPLISLTLSMTMWLSFPFLTNLFSMKLSMLFIISCLSTSVFPILMSGWSSNSNYSMIGTMRAISQTISYEISFILILLSPMILSESFNIMSLSTYQSNSWFMITLMPLFFMFYMSILAELNRTPFDLMEGESELVSGFNTEYFSSGFAMIFMAEYMNIMFMSMLMLLMFTNINLMSSMFMMMTMMTCMSIIWIRGILPRIRYDELMFLCWKKFLPISINFLLLIMGIKSMILF